MGINKVIAGDYAGYKFRAGWGGVYLRPSLFQRGGGNVDINSTTVQCYETISSEGYRSVFSSTASGLIGKLLLGAVGMLSGISTAKENMVFTVSVNFCNGRRSLIEIGDRQYKVLIKSCY